MADIDALLNPKTIAIVGASPEEHKLRGLLPAIMNKHPYSGMLYPVSRSHDEILGMKAYRSIGDIPEAVELAVLVIPSQYVAKELENCGKAGVKAVIIITSGFAEQSGDDGKAMQDGIKEIAAKYDMAVLGPNSEGFANTALSIAATFSPAMGAASKPLLPPWHDEGRVAVIAQSGAVGFSFFDLGREKELPFRYVVTTGNEACLEICDLVDFMLDEGKTDVFILFLEDIKTAKKFRRVADKAMRMGKPLIAVKLGRSEAAARATASHTGALAGSYSSHAAMFEHYGITIGENAEQMVDIANAFLNNLARLPKGRRIGISTGSGGAGAWMADACADEGLEVPELDAKARAVIDSHLPPYGTSQNPVDGTAQAIREVGYSALANMVADADNVDGVIMVASTRKKDGFAGERDNFLKVGKTLPKPILCWSYTLPHETSVEMFGEAGWPLHTNMRHAARSMAALVNYSEARAKYLESSDVPDKQHANFEKAQGLLAGASRVLCEYEARAILALYGIGEDPGVPVTNSDEAVAAASGAGGPVALKIQSPDIPHKSDAGGVALGLEGDDAVHTAYEQVMAAAKASCPDADIRGVLVEPMAAKGVETVLGINADEKFGPMLLAGLGGIHVEVLKDVAFAPVPLSANAAQTLLSRLKGAKILEGVRGSGASDVDALVQTMIALAQFAADFAGEIAEIDLNPVIVHPLGKGVSIVDALIIKQS
jgi:acyl-CoA synthetase (NDP forming)